MAFEPFNLGDVLHNAQVIKGMQDNATMAKLQQQYLGQRITNDAAAAQREQTQYDQNQQLMNTKLLNMAAAEVSQNPQAAPRWDKVLKAAIPDWSGVQGDPAQIQAGAKALFESTSKALQAYQAGGEPQYGAPYVDAKSGATLQSGPGGQVHQVVAPHQPTLPSGYEPDPAKPGALRPIAGGPADQAAAEWTPEAVDLAAERYLIDGTMPPLGMGKSAVRGQIINLAAQKAAERGDSNKAAALNQVASKANNQALAANEKLFTATSGYANTLDKNLDNLLASFKKTDATGVPILNRAVRAWQQGVSGDPDTAEMVVWLNSVQGEFAKLRSGSLGNAPASDQAMRDSKEVINKYMNSGGIQAVANAMRQEKENRLSSIRAESDRLRGALSGGAPSPAAAPPPATPPPQATQGGVAQPKSEAEYNALPSGTQYVAPDGTTRTKR